MPTRNAALLLLVLVASGAWAAGEGALLEPANNDVSNIASLQRGARNFVNYCLGCHSAKYVRYNRLAQDLRLTEEQLIENLMFTGERPFDTMQIALAPADAQRWFGVQPPDLSLIARSRGTDYLYTFLRTFYLDPSRPTGVNNLALPGTAMPHVLWQMQGFQKALYEGETDAEGNMHKRLAGFELVDPGQLSPEDYDHFVRDTVNFLDYIGEPMQLERQRLGLRVITFLFVFFLFAWLLKREYWKDVK